MAENSERVTLVLDIVLIKKLRLIQAKLITQSTKNVSFSKVINDQLYEKLKIPKPT